MNSLCVPPMLMTDGADIKQPLPNMQGQSPVAPTWQWKGENDLSLDDNEPREPRNDYSDASVMNYVNLLPDRELM